MDHQLCLVLMIRYHCPKIIAFLGENNVTAMLDRTQHLYPPDTPNTPRRLRGYLRIEDDDMNISSHPALAHGLPNSNQIDDTTDDDDVKEGLGAHAHAAKPRKREVIVIDDDDDDARLEVVHVDDSSSTIGYSTGTRPQSGWNKTDTDWNIPSSAKLDRKLKITVIFWLVKKTSKNKNRTFTL